MAQGTLAVQDAGRAESWLASCRANNDELHELLIQLGSLIKDVGDGSEGDIVDSFVSYSNRVMKEATTLFEGVSQVAQSISGLINIAKGLVSDIIGGIAKIATGG